MATARKPATRPTKLASAANQAAQQQAILPSDPIKPGSQAWQDKHRKLRSWFELEHRRQEINRYQMALDCDYYDGHQWTQEEAREIRSRGQNPIVFNEIKPTIDWLIGTERRMRRDFKVLARHNKAPEATKDAEVKTQLLKYIADANSAKFERSASADDQLKAGMGWLEVGITPDPDDEPIYVRFESWRNMLHDSLATRQRDFEDGRYIFRFREVDLDVAQAYFPDKLTELERAADFGGLTDVVDDDWHGTWPTSRVLGDTGLPARWLTYNQDSDALNSRRRVALVECWYKEPTRETTGQGAGVTDRVRMKVRCAIFTRHDMLIDIESPYAHNRYPFVPLWCYRSKRDGLPYGPIRNIRGPQDDLNKRMSKSQFLLSSKQLIAEKSAIDNETMDEDEIRDELHSPDGIAIFSDGAISGGKVKIVDGADISAGHLALADRDAFAIRSTSGVSMESRAQDTSAPSGKARAIKEQQQGVITSEIFDNQLQAHQVEGELTLSLIEQWYDAEKTFSVTGERFKLDYFTINEVDPVTGLKVNDVTKHKAQFVIGEQPWKQALAEAAFESAMEMLGQLGAVAPAVVTNILDLVFEWSDMPNKQAIVQRIRQTTGMSDPDSADDPEEQAKAAKKAQVQELEFRLNLEKMRADVKEAQAKGEKLDAEAMAKRLETLYMSAQAAQVLVQAPSAAPVADELLMSAGFKDAGSTQGVIDPNAVPAQAEPAQAAIPNPMQADGAMQGIETQTAADGLQQPPEGAM